MIRVGKLVISHRKLLEGERPPWWYAPAWYETDTRTQVYYPIGLNVVAHVVYDLWVAVMRFLYEDWADARDKACYQRGLEDGAKFVDPSVMMRRELVREMRSLRSAGRKEE